MHFQQQGVPDQFDALEQKMRKRKNMRAIVVMLVCSLFARYGGNSQPSSEVAVSPPLAFQAVGAPDGRIAASRSTGNRVKPPSRASWPPRYSSDFDWNLEPAWKVKSVTMAATAVEPLKATSGEHDSLEFDPYYARSSIPINTFKPKIPYEGKIVSVDRIVGPKATGEICHIVIDHGGNMPYIEGQSIGVVPPGTNEKGRPNKVRLYSIASSRYGDDMTGTTTTLCVRRATYWDAEQGLEDPAKKGLCSNHLCDAKQGDMVKLTGPVGKVMLLPEDKPETDIIMVATGTGIAPYRGFLRRLFVESTPYGRDFKGLAWLFLGVTNSDALLYDEDWRAIQTKHPDQFRYDVALSREQTNKDGGKMYVQDRVEEYSDEIFDRLDKGAHIYFCGLKGMMPGIEDMLEKVATSKGLNYKKFIKALKANGQWHVEVY